MSDWQPIEMAPRDGTEIEVRDPLYPGAGPYRVRWGKAERGPRIGTEYGFIAETKNMGRYKMAHWYTEWRHLCKST